MAGLWQEFVDVVDAQISVKDGLFLTGLRWLMTWPLIPFLIALCFVETPSALANGIAIAVLLIEVPWVIFVVRRRAAKKREWVEPTRFSDDTNGY